MQFMLTVHGAVTADQPYGAYASEDEMNQAFADTGAFNEKLESAGVLRFVAGLMPAETASVVEGRGDAPTVTEGPYLPGPERIGGFWIIDVPSREQAETLAAEASVACRNAIEVRQLAGV